MAETLDALLALPRRFRAGSEVLFGHLALVEHVHDFEVFADASKMNDEVLAAEQEQILAV
jgi:hypothetical protein